MTHRWRLLKMLRIQTLMISIQSYWLGKMKLLKMHKRLNMKKLKKKFRGKPTKLINITWQRVNKWNTTKLLRILRKKLIMSMMPLMQSTMMSCFCHHTKDTPTWQVANLLKAILIYLIAKSQPNFTQNINQRTS